MRDTANDVEPPGVEDRREATQFLVGRAEFPRVLRNACGRLGDRGDRLAGVIERHAIPLPICDEASKIAVGGVVVPVDGRRLECAGVRVHIECGGERPVVFGPQEPVVPGVVIGVVDEHVEHDPAEHLRSEHVSVLRVLQSRGHEVGVRSGSMSLVPQRPG